MKKLLFALAASLIAIDAHAGALDELHAFTSTFKTAQGDFTQKVQSSNQKVLQSSGNFIFARPGRFRWVYQKPYEQSLYADGQTLTLFDHDLNQVTVRKLTDALGSTPAAILFGDNALDHSFDLAEDGTHDGVDWLVATPKTHDTSFTRIRIGFRSGTLAAMELFDALGQKTELSFENVQKNVPVSADTFHFVVPKGADVLQN